MEQTGKAAATKRALSATTLAILWLAGGWRPAPRAKEAALAAFRGQPVVLGLRPEDIGSSAVEPLADAPRRCAAVDVIEPLGGESYVYLRLAGDKLVCRMDAPRQVPVGATLLAAVCVQRAHFLAAQSGVRLA